MPPLKSMLCAAVRPDCTCFIQSVRLKLRLRLRLMKYERTWYSRNRDLVHLKPKFSQAEEELIEART